MYRIVDMKASQKALGQMVHNPNVDYGNGGSYSCPSVRARSGFRKSRKYIILAAVALPPLSLLAFYRRGRNYKT